MRVVILEEQPGYPAGSVWEVAPEFGPGAITQQLAMDWLELEVARLDRSAAQDPEAAALPSPPPETGRRPPARKRGPR